MRIGTWLGNKYDKEIEASERRERILESLPPHKHTAYMLNENTRALLTELRIIRWILLAIAVLLLSFARQYLPSGWWYAPWW